MNPHYCIVLPKPICWEKRACAFVWTAAGRAGSNNGVAAQAQWDVHDVCFFGDLPFRVSAALLTRVLRRFVSC